MELDRADKELYGACNTTYLWMAIETVSFAGCTVHRPLIRILNLVLTTARTAIG